MKALSKIGLALGSGGWRGLAHIGVIKSLVKHNLTISAIAGSSAGSIIGGLYAMWQDIDRIESEFKKLKYHDLLMAFSDPSINLGLIGGKNTLRLLHKYYQNTKIEDLTIPFKAVATDIFSGSSVILDTGALDFAVRASCSVPIIFEPVKYQKYLLIDGGVTNPVPVDIVRSMDVDIVIGVNIYASIFPQNKHISKISKFDLASLSTQLLLNSLSKANGQTADLLISPKLDKAESEFFTQFINNQNAIEQGEIAMDAAIPKLKQLISSPL